MFTCAVYVNFRSFIHVGEEGCWFGNSKSNSKEEKLWVPGVAESAMIRGVDCQLRCKDLCRKLVELVFMEKELRQGNATEARTAGVGLLDQARLYAIRGIYICPSEFETMPPKPQWL